VGRKWNSVNPKAENGIPEVRGRKTEFRNSVGWNRNFGNTWIDGVLKIWASDVNEYKIIQKESKGVVNKATALEKA
jgi:hypothetical protein